MSIEKGGYTGFLRLSQMPFAPVGFQHSCAPGYWHNGYRQFLRWLVVKERQLDDNGIRPTGVSGQQGLEFEPLKGPCTAAITLEAKYAAAVRNEKMVSGRPLLRERLLRG